MKKNKRNILLGSLIWMVYIVWLWALVCKFNIKK